MASQTLLAGKFLVLDYNSVWVIVCARYFYRILDALNTPFETVNVLEDDSIRSGIKVYSRSASFKISQTLISFP